MLQRAQDKVDAIRRVQLRTAGSHPIDEVVFAQNVLTYNPEWQHSNEGKATSYLATLVCRYMNELQRKDKKVVLSAKALEAIYHTASSSVGKLISGKQYLGGYTMEQQRGRAEAEGKELPYKRRKKLQTKDTAIPSTSDAGRNERVLEDSRSSRKPRRKIDSLITVQRITRRFVGFTDDITPADCGLDFEGISSPQSPAITGRTLPNL